MMHLISSSQVSCEATGPLGSTLIRIHRVDLELFAPSHRPSLLLLDAKCNASLSIPGSLRIEQEQRCLADAVFAVPSSRRRLRMSAPAEVSLTRLASSSFISLHLRGNLVSLKDKYPSQSAIDEYFDGCSSCNIHWTGPTASVHRTTTLSSTPSRSSALPRRSDPPRRPLATLSRSLQKFKFVQKNPQVSSPPLQPLAQTGWRLLGRPLVSNRSSPPSPPGAPLRTNPRRQESTPSTRPSPTFYGRL